MAQEKAYRNHAFLIELYRYLHNYLSAAYSFKEHVGAFMARITDTALQADLQKQFKEAGTSDLGRFVQDLRIYVQHSAPPPILSELQIKEIPGSSAVSEEQKLYLKKSKLLAWDRWKPQSRSFIEGHDGDIPLRDTVRQHRDFILSFWSRFYCGVRGPNKESFEELDRLGQEVARLHGWEGS